MSNIKFQGNASGTGTTTLQTANTNTDTTFTLPGTDGTNGQVLQTNGSGALTFGNALTSPASITGTSTAGAELRFPEDTDNGSNYVALKAPDLIASNLTLTLPAADGTSGQALVTDGAGTLSFSNAGISTGKSIAMAMIFGF